LNCAIKEIKPDDWKAIITTKGRNWNETNTYNTTEIKGGRLKEREHYRYPPP
jgi:hypothetical protein